MRWAGQGARMGERRGAYRVLVEMPFVIPIRRRKDTTKMDHQELGPEGGGGGIGLDFSGSG